ncbi:hypothetical protein GW17_00038537 [Ensete ventricosum]|nr:hypothetical protein GW17_00038537 [Ensete ventricosum]
MGHCPRSLFLPCEETEQSTLLVLVNCTQELQLFCSIISQIWYGVVSALLPPETGWLGTSTAGEPRDDVADEENLARRRLLCRGLLLV